MCSMIHKDFDESHPVRPLIGGTSTLGLRFLRRSDDLLSTEKCSGDTINITLPPIVLTTFFIIVRFLP